MELRTILIVEDEDLLRTGLELIINAETDMKVIGTASNGQEALAFLEHTRPDLVLLDLHMPVMDGITCLPEIRRRHKNVPILILTTYNEDSYIFQGLACGANGYLLKGIDFKQLVQTIREALAGHYVLPAEVAATVARYAIQNDIFIKTQRIALLLEESGIFTTKEREILLLLYKRLSNKELGEELFVSEGTIKNHLTTIFEKLHVHTRKEAIQRLDTLAGTGRLPF